jgi:hypothetical protein
MTMSAKSKLIKAIKKDDIEAIKALTQNGGGLYLYDHRDLSIIRTVFKDASDEAFEIALNWGMTFYDTNRFLKIAQHQGPESKPYKRLEAFILHPKSEYTYVISYHMDKETVKNKIGTYLCELMELKIQEKEILSAARELKKCQDYIAAYPERAGALESKRAAFIDASSINRDFAEKTSLLEEQKTERHDTKSGQKPLPI